MSPREDIDNRHTGKMWRYKFFWRQWKMEEAVCWQSMSTYFRTPQYWI